jgi:hypothetical protein
MAKDRLPLRNEILASLVDQCLWENQRSASDAANVVTFDRSIKWLLLCQGSGDKSPQLRTKHSFAMQ